MTTIGLFYGTETGYTELVTNLITEEFSFVAPDLITVHDIGQTTAEKLLDYDFLIIGCPTWDIGQLQYDWDHAYPKLDDLDLIGKKMAIFGLGDQYDYPDSFCDAIGILGNKFIERGAELVGFTPIDEFEFDYSQGVENGVFMGLALDDVNESDRTQERVTNWVWQLVNEFDLVHLLEAEA